MLIYPHITFMNSEFSKFQSEQKAAADKAAADKAAADKAAADKAALGAAASKKTTINCVKGKIKKSVSGINPKCPSGFVKK
jgi:membrane protein involved in colicin uptake